MTVLNAVVRPSQMSRTFENAKPTPLLEVQKSPRVGSRLVVPTILIVSGKRASSERSIAGENPTSCYLSLAKMAADFELNSFAEACNIVTRGEAQPARVLARDTWQNLMDSPRLSSLDVPLILNSLEFIEADTA